jgi:hypothetical protein
MVEMEQLENVLCSDMRDVPNDLILGYSLWLLRSQKCTQERLPDSNLQSNGLPQMMALPKQIWKQFQS